MSVSGSASPYLFKELVLLTDVCLRSGISLPVQGAVISDGCLSQVALFKELVLVMDVCLRYSISSISLPVQGTGVSDGCLVLDRACPYLFKELSRVMDVCLR